MDMHSGGRQKLDWPNIYIETVARNGGGAIDEAKSIFYAKFGRNPYRVTCTCCGEDYSLSCYDDFAQASAWERGCAYDKESKSYLEKPQDKKRSFHKYQTIEEYIASGEAKVIYKDEVDDADRHHSLPTEGFVWMGD
jgi:hypothetical protein